jgi:hypothetical protein
VGGADGGEDVGKGERRGRGGGGLTEVGEGVEEGEGGGEERDAEGERGHG